MFVVKENKFIEFDVWKKKSIQKESFTQIFSFDPKLQYINIGGKKSPRSQTTAPHISIN